MSPTRPLNFWKSFPKALLLSALAAAPALAQSMDEGDWVTGRRLAMDYRTAREMVLAGREQAVAAEKAKPAAPGQQAARTGGYVHETLIAMQDSAGVGEKIAHFIWRTPTVSVQLGKTSEMSWVRGIISTDPKAPVRYEIVVDETLSRYPRVLSVAIARAAFRVMHADMAECAEKRYMEASTVARVWVELGGSLASLPAIEPTTGYKNPEMEELLRSWLGKPSSQALREIGAKTGTISLQALLSDNETELAKLEKAAGDFEADMQWSHHPDPAYEQTLIRLHQARATNAQLEHALSRYVTFMAGEHDRDVTGERVWDLLHPGHHPER